MNGADRGRGRGPWTVHVNFSELDRFERYSEPEVVPEEGSSSRYAEPEAEGVKPVFRTMKAAVRSTIEATAFWAVSTYISS